MIPVRSVILLFLFFRLFFAAQNTAAPSLLLPYSHKIMFVTLTKDPGVIDYYRKIHTFTSSNLYLYKDTTFLFYHTSQEESRMAIGNYRRDKEYIYLYWDSLKTTGAVSDQAFYEKYISFGKPKPLVIKNWKYLVKETEIEPYIPVLADADSRIELLYSSTEIFGTAGKIIHDFKSIKYDVSGNRIIVTYGDNETETIPKFRIWGFVIYNGASPQVYRRTKLGFNWYGIPGAQIAQLDGIVIYTVGEQRRYSYFSRDLDSPILPLTLKELKREFHGNKKFIMLLTKEFHSNRILSDLDEHFNSYKVVELYLKSMEATEGL
jgi:hypothetical protein